ncbi:MAG: hypothetical protein CVV23_15075 [Ignavibacteriae bacterium HGW-Ignavibacteriae-2]|jgi:hypothetical protein|nr:hypothetical protein [Bacteroidota bacterium]PKL87482.1 MAG: hypothetical protein CVV23_15075 [Ignavibacteriae bacterium HGW-Ignavibacteriae-2]PKP12427.1 MAG: hypothetical protein CVU08_10590 [Bacteroidetes bacterium HGW-Bacteroidetes-3]
MYNIDFSFLQTKQIDGSSENCSQKYNDLYKKNLISKICPNFNTEIKCSNCDVHSTTLVDVDPRQIIEVNCKGMMGHQFCEVFAVDQLELYKDDIVLVKMDDCLDIAVVDEVGDIVKLRRQRLGLIGEAIPVIVRKASQEDLEKYSNNIDEENRAKPIFHEKVLKFQLLMKLVDIHYQFDKKRLFFFYTSEGRVDFRELAKELAGIFKTRIELRQIGVRDEAKRIGGLGACGREYCCSSFLYSFKRITTQIATDQNLSANLSKLSGPCGKLKCCLSFEIEENIQQ